MNRFSVPKVLGDDFPVAYLSWFRTLRIGPERDSDTTAT